MIIPDSTKRTVRLAIRIEGEKVLQLDRSSLPKVKDGTVGDLILLASDLVNHSDRKTLQSESFTPLLPEGSTVFVGLSPETMDRSAMSQLRKASDLNIGAGYCFAEVQLQQVLVLRLRGYKDPCLESCNCIIPVLKTNAKSLNHAFTLLSTVFETNRISHTGNVFERVYYWTKRGFRPLNEARGRVDL